MAIGISQTGANLVAGHKICPVRSFVHVEGRQIWHYHRCRLEVGIEHLVDYNYKPSGRKFNCWALESQLDAVC